MASASASVESQVVFRSKQVSRGLCSPRTHLHQMHTLDVKTWAWLSNDEVCLERGEGGQASSYDIYR